jgi:hypothetical protein
MGPELAFPSFDVGCVSRSCEKLGRRKQVELEDSAASGQSHARVKPRKGSVLKFLGCIAAFSLLAGSAFGGETTFLHADGGVVVRSTLLSNERDPLGFLPGETFQAVLEYENRSSEAVDLQVTLRALRYRASDRAEISEPWILPLRLHLGPGETVHEMLVGVLPLDALAGSHFMVGMSVALATDATDMRVVFDSALVLSDGFPRGSIHHLPESSTRPTTSLRFLPTRLRR